MVARLDRFWGSRYSQHPKLDLVDSSRNGQFHLLVVPIILVHYDVLHAKTWPQSYD